MKDKPQLKLVVNQWSLRGYPTPENEWSDQKKIEAIKHAGFDGVAPRLKSEMETCAIKAGLGIYGGTDIGSIEEAEEKLKAYKERGVIHINVQLCDHDTSTEKALPIAIRVIELGDQLGIKPAIEVHRDTCTETPEKAYALADAFEKATKRLLRMNFDYSHPAIIKHLAPEDYFDRLVERVDLLVYGELIHFRPFNGHHCQIPITDGKNNLSPEFKEWLPFCDRVIQTWLQHSEAGRELVVVPEQGPRGGYGLSCFPDIWEDVLVLTQEIRKIWNKQIKQWKPNPSVKSVPEAVTAV